MTEEQITKSIESQELKLLGWRKFTHYEIVSIFLLIAAITLVLFLRELINGTPKAFEKLWPVLLIFMLIPIGLARLYYKIQRNKLKFRIYSTTISREHLDRIIAKVAKDFQWKIIINKGNLVEAKTSPSFWSGSWGELITILIDGQTILANCICDPDKQASVTSYGRNKKQLDKLIEEIDNASR